MIIDSKEKISKIIDVSKAICIISVVLGHSCPFSNFFYFFHLQTFFFINAILLKISYTVKDFVLKKVKTLYIPYIVIMLIVALIYDTKSLFDFKYLLKIFLFDGAVPGLGAMWFVPCLFINTTIAFLLHKICNKPWWNVILLLMFVFLSYFIYFCKLHFYYNLHLVPYIQIIYCIGFYLNKDKLIKLVEKKLYLFFVLSTLTIIFLYKFSTIQIDLVNDKLVNPILWVILIILGVFFVFSLSIIIQHVKWITFIFVYVGKSSFYVMCFHFIVFSLINVTVSLFNGTFSTELFHLYSVQYKNLYIIYVIFGVSIPVLLNCVCKRIYLCMK